MIASDRDFVVSGWSSSFRQSFHAGMLSMESYALVMHREIARILDHPSTETLVAEELGQTDHLGRPFLYGFLTRRRGAPYVYYCYVKSPYRRGQLRHGLRAGYATPLFAAAGIDPRAPFGYACQTPYVSKLARRIPLAQWDPLPARYLETSNERTEEADYPLPT